MSKLPPHYPAEHGITKRNQTEKRLPNAENLYQIYLYHHDIGYYAHPCHQFSVHPEYAGKQTI